MASILVSAFGVIVILLVFSAFLSGSETALTAVSRARMHQLEKDGSRAAHDVNAFVHLAKLPQPVISKPPAHAAEQIGLFADAFGN